MRNNKTKNKVIVTIMLFVIIMFVAMLLEQADIGAIIIASIATIMVIRMFGKEQDKR